MSVLDEQAVRAAIVEALRVHPRLVQQRIGTGEDVRERLLQALPALHPFRARQPSQIAAVLDWDHRLPSQRVYLRLFLNYDAESTARFEAGWSERAAHIAQRDLFPEFDVPDFEDLPADEAYEADLTAALLLEGVRLTSSWRRDIESEVASRAVQLVRASAPFARVRATQTARPSHLGDLDPVSWMPPCESGHVGWTVDVWWLTSFDGRTGTGFSFLVDLSGEGQVITHREFSVRAG